MTTEQRPELPTRFEFPLLSHRPDLVYLDNAATTQKPLAVIEALNTFYLNYNANVHRGAHELSDRATEAFENARAKLVSFINASDRSEVIWTRGTTESINLVAQIYAERLRASDEVIISEMEHHSNIVPWQQLCERTDAKLLAVQVTEEGTLDLEHYRSLLSERTKVVALAHVSNALGTVNPIKEIARDAHDVEAIVVVDGAQAAPHEALDVQDLDVDFYAFSGHKMYGPTGIGVLYGKATLLDAMPPWQGGGEMIEHVTLEKTTYQKAPFRFEAGTPDISGVIGLGAAVDFLNLYDPATRHAHEQSLLIHATSALHQIEGVRVVGTAPKKTALVSFNIDGSHHSDIGMLLDQQKIAVRTGHHCAMPLMQKYGIPGTVRASFGLYNSKADVDALVRGVQKSVSMVQL